MLATFLLIFWNSARVLCDFPPNLDHGRFGINIFKGIPPEEQIASGSQYLFTFSDSGNNNQGYDIPIQATTTFVAKCNAITDSTDVFWSTSSSSLERQSKSAEFGYDAQVTIGLEYSGVSAETTLRNALIFGNSAKSFKNSQQLSSGKTYTFDTSVVRSTYQYTINYDQFSDNDWTPQLKNAILGLGNGEIKDYLNFFDKFGTHGLHQVYMGQLCSSSAYMTNNLAKNCYSDYKSKTKSTFGSLLFLGVGSSTTTELASSECNYATENYFIENRECSGSLTDNHPCLGEDEQTASVDSLQPAIVDWTYKPIWDMNIPGLTASIKSEMKITAEMIYDAGIKCRNDYCNGNGYCAPNKNIWQGLGSITINDQNNFNIFWNGNICFCDDTFRGNTCDKGSLLAIDRHEWTGWKNSFDNALEFFAPDNKVICGMDSVHSNSYEDRLYQFLLCKPQLSQYATFVPEPQYIEYTYFGDHWSFSCDSDKVLRNVISYHVNSFEDRRFKFQCFKYQNTITTNCEWTDWQNTYDNPVNHFMCPIGKIMHGMESMYNTHNEDRIFKFECCELEIENEKYKYIGSVWDNNYANDYDAAFWVDGQQRSPHQIICGVHSIHDNFREDRIFKFRWCNPISNNVIVDPEPWTNNVNNWDKEFWFECPRGKFIVGFHSFHYDVTEDRRFQFYCGKFANSEEMRDEDISRWTPFLNDYDEPFTHYCGEQYGLVGVHSIHDNNREDRRYSFRCARFRVTL